MPPNHLCPRAGSPAGARERHVQEPSVWEPEQGTEGPEALAKWVWSLGRSPGLPILLRVPGCSAGTSWVGAGLQPLLSSFQRLPQGH